MQVIVELLTYGAIQALIAAGFVLTFNGAGLINFSHGTVVVLGALIAAALSAALTDWPLLAFLPLVALATALAGVLIAAIANGPLRGAADEIAHLGMLCIAAAIGVFTGLEGGVAPLVAAPLSALRAAGEASVQSLVMLGVAVVLVSGLSWFVAATQPGRRIRAAAQDPELARAIGIDAARTVTVAFALAAACAGVAGLLLAGRVDALGGGLGLTVQAFIAAALSGWRRVGYAAAIAALLAILGGAIAGIAGPIVATALIYAVLAAGIVMRRLSPSHLS